ncbi:ectoine/hydroxyectoine ABC transporter substrate-binding protein EhuB 3 (plasmid) [Rhizobium gallicum]|uniref:Ectoine/hydroxyectoine ABC transporter substrate-binding protein EhuB 3 n=1 Tax=Rhizobium gallicum TaxID=56730 RepID=A0A1L5NR66_9HYPH|nr:ectoine/hydroxyectoine ABC transporter substrate-binding protein EhuB [Rhizobium gallicum]APO70396.1 ectoine/hydroxyectoine ABC transporter substrate-binding protein EhuB 3 [Rhizobium gallicum]
MIRFNCKCERTVERYRTTKDRSRHFVASAALATIAAAMGIVMSAKTADAVTLEEVKARGYITIAIANEIPGSYTDANGEVKGSEAEVARRVLEKMGIKGENIQWVVTTFSSLIPGLQAKRFDMTAAAMAIRPERCQKVIYSEPSSSYGEGLLVIKGNPKSLHSYEDVAKQGTVAIMAGADQLNMMQALGMPEDRIITIAANADAISAIATGRADAYAAADTTAADLAKKNDKVEAASPFTDPVIDGKTQRSWGSFNFNKDSTDLRDKFNEALLEFRKTDEFKQILLEYGSTPEAIAAIPDKTTRELCSQ